MKITFKGDSLVEILSQMEQFYNTSQPASFTSPVTEDADILAAAGTPIPDEAPKPEPKKRKAKEVPAAKAAKKTKKKLVPASPA